MKERRGLTERKGCVFDVARGSWNPLKELSTVVATLLPTVPCVQCVEAYSS